LLRNSATAKTTSFEPTLIGIAVLVVAFLEQWWSGKGGRKRRRPRSKIFLSIFYSLQNICL